MTERLHGWRSPSVGRVKKGLETAAIGGGIDIALLMSLWLLVLIASIRNVGIAGSIAFVALSCALVVRRTANGMLVLLLIFYSPATMIGVPSVFSVTAAITLAKIVLVDFAAGRVRIAIAPVLYAASAYVLIATVMTWAAPDVSVALIYYRKYVEGLVLLVLFGTSCANRQDLNRLIVWWVVFAALATIIRIVHLSIGDDTVLYRAMQAAFASDQYDVEHRTHILVGDTLARRLVLPGEEPNYTSASLVFPFALALGLVSTASGRPGVMWMLAAGTVAAGLIGTFSRSGFIAAAGVFAFFVIGRWSLRAILSGTALATSMWTALVLNPALQQRIFGIDVAISEGATGRFELWHRAIQLWLEAPILGSGMAAYYHMYHSAAHSTYLQVLAETGVVGLAVFLAVIAAALIRAQRRRSVAMNPSAAVDERMHYMSLAGLVGFCAIIGTVTYQDIKLFWLACGAFAGMCTASRDAAGVDNRIGPPDALGNRPVNLLR